MFKLKTSPLIDNLKLNTISRTKKVKLEDNIFKKNQEYIKIIDIEYTGIEKFGKEKIDKAISELNLPIGYEIDYKDKKDFFIKESQLNYMFLIFLAIGIIYLVCSCVFESALQPLIVLSIIPFSYIGVFLIFYTTRSSFDYGGFSSFILLSGITVNSSILIINRFNNLQIYFPNESKLNLYLKVIEEKTSPILIMILSTIISFIPFIIYGEDDNFWFSLGLGVIGGLMFSLIGIFVFLPILLIKRI